MNKSDKDVKKAGVKSPCVKKCSLGLDKVCPECHRTIDEIVAWPDADDLTRTMILEAARSRKASRR